MSQPQMTGFDYMIGVADKRAENGEPYAEEFKQMLWDYASDPSERKDTPGERVVMRPLRPEESAAVGVAASAAGIAMEQVDRESLQEVLFWGIGLSVKFREWLEATGRMKG